jgi:uncharacterized protein YecE (DUF72 family)
MKNNGKFRAGTSGLVLQEPNKQSFPPEFQHKSRLTYYASKFDSIEINSSFYKMPRAPTYQKWSEMVPVDFQFTVKLWRGITHEKQLVYQMKDLEAFFSAVDYLGDKKGCLLMQFPAKTDMTSYQFGKLLEAVRKCDPNETWRIAVEFRHARWYQKNIYGLLNDWNASLVLHDMPASVPMELNDKAPFIYLRFHGEKGDYRGSYGDHFLFAKAKEIREWLNERKDVYAYFNNTIGSAVENLKTLKEIIGRSGGLTITP